MNVSIFQTRFDCCFFRNMAAPTQDQVSNLNILCKQYPYYNTDDNHCQMTELQDLAHKLRIHSVNMTTASKSGHPTSCSSMAEVGTMTMLSHFTTVQLLGDVRPLLQSDALLCGGAKTCGQRPFHPLQRPCRTHLVCSMGGGNSHSLKSYF